MLYQEKWPPRPGAAPPEAPKIWGTGAYSTMLFQARSGSGGGSVGAVAAADAADAAAAAAVAAAAAALAPTSPSSANSSRRTWPSSVSSP